MCQAFFRLSFPPTSSPQTTSDRGLRPRSSIEQRALWIKTKEGQMIRLPCFSSSRLLAKAFNQMSRYFNSPIRFEWLEAAKHVFLKKHSYWYRCSMIKKTNKNSKNALVKLAVWVFQGTRKVFLMDLFCWHVNKIRRLLKDSQWPSSQS